MTQLDARVLLLEDARIRIEGKQDRMEDRVDKAESRLDILGARIGVYATLGATVGGAIAVTIARLAFGG